MLNNIILRYGRPNSTKKKKKEKKEYRFSLSATLILRRNDLQNMSGKEVNPL